MTTVLYRRRRCGAPAQSYSPVHYLPAVHCGKRPSAPSQRYRRSGGLAAAAATVLYRRRRCDVARTVSHDNYDYRCTAAETVGYAPRTSSPRARLVGIARTRFPKPGRRNVAPVAVAAGKTNAAVGDDCRVAHKLPSSWAFCLLKKTKCTNQNVQIYLEQCALAREGPVRLPQHLQNINRSSSPIRSLSLLHSPCSTMLTQRFSFSAVHLKKRYRV